MFSSVPTVALSAASEVSVVLEQDLMDKATFIYVLDVENANGGRYSKRLNKFNAATSKSASRSGVILRCIIRKKIEF